MNTLNQEADMGYIKDFVSKIAEALVAATELPKQMAEIKSDMSNLSSDLEKTKARNIELDTMLADTRRQRDEAEQALSTIKSDRAQVEFNLNAKTTELDLTNQELDRVKAKLDQVTKDRDDYGMKQMEAEERASQAEAKLAKLAEALGLPPPEPKTVLTFPPEPALSQSAPQAVTEPAPTTTTTSHGMALAEPAPLKRIYEGEPGYHYNTYDKWDQVKQRYYNEVDDMPF